MMKILKEVGILLTDSDHMRDVIAGKTTVGNKRSKEWPKVRESYLKIQPICQVCGGKEKLEVHHLMMLLSQIQAIGIKL